MKKWFSPNPGIQSGTIQRHYVGMAQQYYLRFKCWRRLLRIVSVEAVEGAQPDGRLSVGQGGKRQNFGFHGLIGEISGSSRSDADSCLVVGLNHTTSIQVPGEAMIRDQSAAY